MKSKLLLFVFLVSLPLFSDCPKSFDKLSHRPKLIGFSKDQAEMLGQSLRVLEDAGYDTSPFKELIRSDMPKGYRGMSLDDGAALSNEAFSSLAMLNHVLEEELNHNLQKAEGKFDGGIYKGKAQELEDEVDRIQKFPAPDVSQ